MKFKPTKSTSSSTTTTTSVLGLPSVGELATLLAVNNTDRCFEYRLSFSFDPNEAYEAGSTYQVEVQVATAPIIANSIDVNSISNVTDNRKMVKNILNRNVAIRDSYRASESNVISRFNIDLTSLLPNDKITTIKNKAVAQFTTRQETVIRPVSIQELKEKNISMPVLDSNLNRFGDNGGNVQDSVNVRNDSLNLIYQKKIDPASFVGKKTETLLSAARTRQGTTVSKNYRQFAANNQSSFFFQETRLIRSLLSTNQAFNQKDLSPNTMLNVPTTETTTRLIVEKVIRIPFDDRLGSEFYINLRLKNRNGLYVQNLSRLIGHARNVERNLLPVLAPSISVLKNTWSSETVLGLQQNDINATKIRLYRRDLNKTVPVTTSEYIFVGEVDLEKDGGMDKLIDPHISLNPTIYRAIPVNDKGIIGGNFNSVVTEAKRSGEIRRMGKRNQQSCFVSMVYTMDSSGITVSVSNIPPGAIAIELIRLNKTNFQKTYDRVGDNVIQITDISNASISFLDNTVSKYKIYEYKVRVFYKNGTTQIATNELLIDYDPVTNNIVDVTVDSPQTVNTDSGGLDITFNITKSIIQTDTNTIKSFLESQGFIGEFQNEILANREKLGNLFAVSVKRFNITTGELEDFGIIDSSAFSDSKYGQPKGVKPVMPGYDYRYVLTTYARDPETLFATSERTVVTSVSSDRSYVLKPQKWLHPVTLQDGNLVTETTLQRNHAYTTFSFGAVVDMTEVNVSLSDILPSIYDSKATQIARNKALVEWKVQGNVLKVDHFIIVLESIGIKTIVGKCHNLSNSNYFQFVDEFTNGEMGEMTYSVTPVFFDYSRGSAVKTNSIII